MFSLRNTKLTASDKAELKKEILAVTPVAVLPSKGKAVKQPKPVKQSAKAKAVVQALSSLPSDWRGTDRQKFLTQAFEAILGEKVVLTPATVSTGVTRIDKSNLRKFQAIVPEANPNSHNYPIGKVALLLQNGGNICLRADGTPGNEISRSSCRYATVQEIDQFLNELQKNTTVEALTKYLG